VMGLLYYPQYGHTIFDGLSNMVATLWRKNISYNDVEFSPYLFRNTSTLVSGVPATQYRLQWFDMYDELFRFHAADITPWTNFIDLSQLTNQTICFRRIMVGALPHLDLMNITAPSTMWERFSRGIISSFYWDELLELGETVTSFTPHDVSAEQLGHLSPAQYPNYHLEITRGDDPPENAVSPFCAVTIVTRNIHNARSIANAQDLADVAITKGCHVQVISLEKYSMKEQIGEVRWNTTLLVSVDGSALLNTLFMHKCSTVLYVEMWRRAMMIPKFEPAVWTGYTPRAADTSFVNMSDPLAVHLTDLIASFTSTGLEEELETIGLDVLPFPNKQIEDFLRNMQSTTIRMEAFERVLYDSIQHNKQCRHPHHRYHVGESSPEAARGSKMVFKMKKPK
jgi:hypothetical protein